MAATFDLFDIGRATFEDQKDNAYFGLNDSDLTTLQCLDGNIWLRDEILQLPPLPQLCAADLEYLLNLAVYRPLVDHDLEPGNRKSLTAEWPGLISHALESNISHGTYPLEDVTQWPPEHKASASHASTPSPGPPDHGAALRTLFDSGLMRHLHEIRQHLLLSDGTFAQRVHETFFTNPSAISVRSAIEAAYALRPDANGPSHHRPSTLRLALASLTDSDGPSTTQHQTPASDIVSVSLLPPDATRLNKPDILSPCAHSALAFLHLGHTVPEDFRIFFTEEISAGYRELFHALLAISHTLATATDTKIQFLDRLRAREHPRSSNTQGPVSDAHLRTALRTIHSLHGILSTLYATVQASLTSTWTELTTVLAQLHSALTHPASHLDITPSDLHALHLETVHQLRSLLFLHADQTRIRHAFTILLDSALESCRILRLATHPSHPERTATLAGLVGPHNLGAHPSLGTHAAADLAAEIALARTTVHAAIVDLQKALKGSADQGRGAQDEANEWFDILACVLGDDVEPLGDGLQGDDLDSDDNDDDDDDDN